MLAKHFTALPKKNSGCSDTSDMSTEHWHLGEPSLLVSVSPGHRSRWFLAHRCFCCGRCVEFAVKDWHSAPCPQRAHFSDPVTLQTHGVILRACRLRCHFHERELLALLQENLSRASDRGIEPFPSLAVVQCASLRFALWQVPCIDDCADLLMCSVLALSSFLPCTLLRVVATYCDSDCFLLMLDDRNKKVIKIDPVT